MGSSRPQPPAKPPKALESCSPSPNLGSFPGGRAAVVVAEGGEGGGGSAAFAVEGAEEDEALREAGALSREEVLRRRCRRLRQLRRCYRRQYWALMEEVRVKHRDYYWEFGVSPFEEEDAGGGGREGAWRGPKENGGGAMEGAGETGRLGLGFGEGESNGGVPAERGERKRCAFAGCKSKAMPLTRFCHPHILSDCKQTLYKACNFVIKSAHGHLTCGKPVLKTAAPSLCPVHLQKVQKHISQALKKAGLSTSSSSRPAPKLNVLISEYVRHIQARRRELLNPTIQNTAQEDEKGG